MADYDVKYRWDIDWGETRQQQVDRLRAEGKAPFRKNGQPDMRWRGNKIAQRLADEDAGIKPRSMFA